METYERRNHKQGKMICIITMVFSILMIGLFTYLYIDKLNRRPLIDYPTYLLSTKDWTNENVVIQVTNNPEKVSAYSFDGGKNFQSSGNYEVPENGRFIIVLKDVNGRLSKQLPVNITNIDKVAPQINFENPTTVQLNNNSFSLRSGVVVNEEGSGLNNNYVVVPDKIDITKEGTYTVTYTAYDNVGNHTEKKRTIIVKDVIGRTYYRYRTSTTETYQCEPYNCNCVSSNDIANSKTCGTGYVFESPNKCCQTCYKTCSKVTWSNWSNWSQKKVTANSTTEVETKVE